MRGLITPSCDLANALSIAQARLINSAGLRTFTNKVVDYLSTTSKGDLSKISLSERGGIKLIR